MTEAKIALVTGGSRRIGRAIVEALTGDGWRVAIHANASITEAEDLVRAIGAQGGEAAAFAADLADPQAVAGLMPAVIKRFGPVTLLVNNASLFLRDTLTSIDVPTWNRQFSVNIRAPSVLAGAMATALPAPREGAIVNIVDQRVLKLTPEFYSYTLSKAALHAATRTMAQALAPRIRVNAVAPGPVLPNEADGDEGFLREVAGLPLEHAVSPQEIAAAVLHLAKARSVTGQTLAVDGGQHIGWRTPDIVT